MQAESQPQQKAPAEGTARLDDLGRQVEDLKARMDRLPKPAAMPDLEPITQKLAAVDDLSHKLEAQQSRYGTLPEKIDDNAKRVTSLKADLEGVRSELSTLRGDLQSKHPAGPAAASSPVETAALKTESAAASSAERPVEDAFARGVEQYQKKQYRAASDTFGALTRDRADDARTWYYAALARGFATGDWKGETEKLVTQGMDREKAGQPERSQIDAAFSGLTTDTGKDWLAFYRRRAAASGDPKSP